MCKLREILPPLGLAVVLAIGFGAVLALAAGWGTASGTGCDRIASSAKIWRSARTARPSFNAA